jgi:hypothetical protein
VYSVYYSFAVSSSWSICSEGGAVNFIILYYEVGNLCKIYTRFLLKHIEFFTNR